MTWTIYYSDSKVSGSTEKEWDAAQTQDVQIVVVDEPSPSDHNPWSGFKDIQLWTGDDEYSINGWSIKYGKWMDYDLYIEMWKSLKNYVVKKGTICA